MPMQDAEFLEEELERINKIAEKLQKSSDELIAQLMSVSLDPYDRRKEPRPQSGEIRFLKRVK